MNPVRRDALKRVAASAGILGLSGCCQLRHLAKAPSLDYFQRYLIIGSGPRTCCPIPYSAIGPTGLTAFGFEALIDRDTEFWIRAVQVEATHLPSPLETYERNIQLDVVDALGAATTGAVIVPSVIRTGADGYNDTPIIFRPTEYRTFRIQARYPDREAISRALSPFVIVRS